MASMHSTTVWSAMSSQLHDLDEHRGMAAIDDGWNDLADDDLDRFPSFPPVAYSMTDDDDLAPPDSAVFAVNEARNARRNAVQRVGRACLLALVAGASMLAASPAARGAVVAWGTMGMANGMAHSSAPAALVLAPAAAAQPAVAETPAVQPAAAVPAPAASPAAAVAPAPAAQPAAPAAAKAPLTGTLADLAKVAARSSHTPASTDDPYEPTARKARPQPKKDADDPYP
jgi:hypothetical protein